MYSLTFILVIVLEKQQTLLFCFVAFCSQVQSVHLHPVMKHFKSAVCVCAVPWLSRMTMPPSIRARGVAEWFDWKENDVNQKLWPSRSPNLNPIERNYRRIWPTSWTELSATFIITPREETSFGQRVFIPAVQFQRISVTRTTKHLLCMNVCLSIVK